MKSKFGFAISLLIACASCQKNVDVQPEQQPESQIQKSSYENASIEGRRTYLRENFKIIATELGNVMKEPGFRNLIKSEVAKKFDGDYNVLIKTLLSNPVYGARINTEEMRKTLDAFKGLEGENFYPQIYVPRFRKAQEETETAASSSNPVQFIFYDGNEEIIEFPGYTYNAEGELDSSGIMINEEYALNHEVYVISLNESVDAEGLLSAEAEHAATFKPGGRISSPAVTNDIMAPVNFWIKDITPKVAKESWVAGALEVNIKSEAYTWNMRYGGSTTGQAGYKYTTLRYVNNTTNFEGFQIVKVDRQEVGYPIWNINYPLNTNWLVDNFNTDPIAYAYVIFEYDAAPAAQRTSASLIPSSNDPNYNKAFLNYRSSDVSYGGDVAGYSAEVNYAIYGNVDGFPWVAIGYKNLYYNPYRFKSPSLDFSTEKY